MYLWSQRIEVLKNNSVLQKSIIIKHIKMEIIKRAAELANSAKTHIKDADLFNNYIQEIVDIEDPNLIKSDLIDLIGAEYGEWSDKFLLHDIKYCKLPSKIVQLLQWYLMTNDLPKYEAKDVFKELVITKFNEAEGLEFYALVYELFNNNIPRYLIPNIFTEEDREYPPIELFTFVGKQFELDKDGNIIYNKDWLSEQNEMEEDSKNYSEDGFCEEDLYDDYWAEEELYRSCFDKDGNVSIEKLKEVQYKSLKAHYKLLQINNTDINDYFYKKYSRFMSQKEGSKIKYLLAWDINEDDDNTYCPYCKKKVVVNEYDVYDIKPCKHFAFYYGMIGLQLASKEFVDRCAKVGIDISDYPNSIDTLELLGYGDTMTVIDISESGIACGPTSVDAYIGFDKKQKEYIDGVIEL